MQEESEREIFTSSYLHDPTANSETSPLLRRGNGLQSGSLSGSSALLGSRYHFNLKREKLRCKRMFYSRIPKGKAAFVVFLVNFLESFAFHGALDLIRFTVFADGASPKTNFLFTIFFFTAGRVFYPFAGLIADVYAGRYRVIHAGLWLFFAGFVIILMGMAFEWRSDALPVKIPAIVATVLFMLASASVESTIIPFGVDQIQQGATSDEISSYFSWYYFGRNLGYIVNILGTFAIHVVVAAVNDRLGWSELNSKTLSDRGTKMEHAIINSIAGFFGLTGLVIAMLLHFCLQHWFYQARQRENPIRSICNVLYFAATVKRHAPRYRRSFRYGEERKSRMELAKTEFDGIYSSEEVEDVKTFFRVLFLALSLGGCFATFGALSGMYSFVTAECSLVKGSYSALINSSVVLLFIPFLNNFLLPCFPGVSIKRRIGTGVFFFLLSTVLGTIINWRVTLDTSPSMLQFLFTIPIVVVALGDALVFISGLEFIYAQSPDSMKGLLTGLFYFIFGIFNAVGTGLFRRLTSGGGSTSSKLSAEPPTLSNLSCSEMHASQLFYYIALIICAIGFAVYIVVAACYKNRQRPTNDESEQEILHRSIATSVYLSHGPA